MGNFRFKKKYGQNFLMDKNILNKIISSVDKKSNSLVIEIGCGSGNLTKFLCENFDYVLGYEIDTELKDQIEVNLSNYNNYELIFDDFLNRDINKDVDKFSYDNIYVVANIPYYITTPIVEKLVLSDINITQMLFMVQKEVGERFSAKIGTKKYGSLTVFLNYFYDVKSLFVVSRNSFYPKPDVDSIIVSFDKKKKYVAVDNEEFFFKLVRNSFQFKRKTIRNNLRDYDLKVVEKVLEKHGLNLSSRAEQIDFEVFCDISNAFS